MPRTILTVVSSLARGGPMNVLVNLVRPLDPLRYRSVVATLSPETADTLIDDFRALGIPVRQMRLSRAGSFVTGVRSLQRLVAEVQPDLVHTHGFRADVLASKAGLKCPVVSTLHCELGPDYRLKYGRVAGAWMAARHYAALRRFHRVIAVSDNVAAAALKSGVAARAIPNGVDLALYWPPSDPGSVEAMRASLGWAAGAMVALHTGSLSSRKNPLEVLAAFRASRFSANGILVFAGDGPLRAECEKAAGEARNIVFLGKRQDVPDLLKAADVLISASSAEGLPMALLEGCATGIPVFATDIPPHVAIQQIFPGQVRLFNRNRSASLVDLLDTWESNPQRFLPRQSALEAISSQKMSTAYQEQYTQSLQAFRSADMRSRKVAPCRSGFPY